MYVIFEMTPPCLDLVKINGMSLAGFIIDFCFKFRLSLLEIINYLLTLFVFLNVKDTFFKSYQQLQLNLDSTHLSNHI